MDSAQGQHRCIERAELSKGAVELRQASTRDFALWARVRCMDSDTAWLNLRKLHLAVPALGYAVWLS